MSNVKLHQEKQDALRAALTMLAEALDLPRGSKMQLLARGTDERLLAGVEARVNYANGSRQTTVKSAWTTTGENES